MKQKAVLWGARVSLLMASLLIAGLLGEVWARWNWPAATPRHRRDHEALADLPELKTVWDLVQPNVHGHHRGVELRTNSQGIRGPEYSKTAPPDTFRIGVGGDSVGMGWGVAEDARYSAVVERRLLEARGDQPVEIINTAVAGVNALIAVDRLLELDAFYHFDLLVYGFTPNDIEGVHYVKRTQPEGRIRRFAEARRARTSPSYLWRFIAPGLTALRDRVSGAPDSTSAEIVYNYFENEPAWNEFGSALDLLAARSVGSRRCGVVLIHTQLSELGLFHPYHGVYEKVTEAAESRGLVTVQTFDAFAGRYEPQFWVGPRDPHPNAEAHAILGDLLADALLDLPTSCWSRSQS